ncbi:MAG: ThuA domain-containing protein [Tannerella sp.]|jgi:type 1 glutamine amidotransferase|nr:ThuA domain-containing protein [Tannerella sp.]
MKVAIFCENGWKRVMNGLFELMIALACVCVCAGFQSCRTEKEKVHVLLVTGGHDYDREGFDELLGSIPVTYEQVAHPDAYARLKAEAVAAYDAVLLYDMPAEIPAEAQADFVAMLEHGKGLVVLHHAFCSYDSWPEYTRIAGGRYHHFEWSKDGETYPPSRFTHDVTFDVEVADRNHPVTKGVSDFRITDETYAGTEILPTVHPLLSTAEPSSNSLLAWAHTYGHARVVTLTPGHDRHTWENPAFRTLLSQAILWVAE